MLDALDADPRLVFRVPLSPAQLPALVENTPVIAFEVLLRLMRSRRMGERPAAELRRCCRGAAEPLRKGLHGAAACRLGQLSLC